MTFKRSIVCLFSAFIAYCLGRAGHVVGGTLPTPHHWIYGLILVAAGLFFERKSFGIPLMFFGIGLFVSDLSDFLHLRFYGEDVVKTFKFWGID